MSNASPAKSQKRVQSAYKSPQKKKQSSQYGQQAAYQERNSYSKPAHPYLRQQVLHGGGAHRMSAGGQISAHKQAAGFFDQGRVSPSRTTLTAASRSRQLEAYQ